MDVVNKPYPEGFNNLCERHPEAKPGHPRRILHDRYSLVHITESECFYSNLDKALRSQLQHYKTSESRVFPEL